MTREDIYYVPTLSVFCGFMKHAGTYLVLWRREPALQNRNVQAKSRAREQCNVPFGSSVR